MGNDEKDGGIDSRQVESFFDNTANTHKNINAVLDVSQTKEALYANIYRDYFTKKYLIKNINPRKNDSILDFGCGVGRVTFFLAPHVKNISGIDVSKNMLEIANHEKQNFHNVSFDHLTGTVIPDQDNSFNKIFSHWVLQHISDEMLVLYLKEFYRVLKKGGRIFLFEQTMQHSQSNSKHIYRTEENYMRLIESVPGFKKIAVKPVMRVPARGMSLWNKKTLSGKIALSVFSLIDNLTINYKKQHVKYYTSVFIYEK